MTAAWSALDLRRAESELCSEKSRPAARDRLGTFGLSSMKSSSALFVLLMLQIAFDDVARSDLKATLLASKYCPGHRSAQA